MLITHFLPGQEEKNFNYLVRNRLIMNDAEKNLVPKPEQALMIMRTELATGAFRESLKANSTLIAYLRPGHEGERVIQAVTTMFHEKN
jgi:hypothetical protein